MRSMLILFLIVIFGEIAAQADTLVVTGVLLNPDKSRAGGYTVRIFAGRPGVGDASDSTSSYGVYTVVKQNVDSGTINSWYLICEQDRKKAYSRLLFESRPNNIWQAKVEDLSLHSTDQASYSVNEASETIRVATAIQAIKVKSGQLSSEAANEAASAEAARVLGRTSLGENPEVTLRSINRSLRLSSESALPILPLLSEEKFLLLRDRCEFKNSLPDIDKPFNETQSTKPVTQPPIAEPQRSLICVVCIRFASVNVEDRLKDIVGKESCETVNGRTDEELKAAAVKKICGTNSSCVEASTVPKNVRVKCNQP